MILTKGLELCTTEYALIAQHDRNFRIPFPYTGTLLDAMDQHQGIRYIGFPTNANINHDILIKTQYNLDVLNTNYSYNLLPSASLRLQPLIFWSVCIYYLTYSTDVNVILYYRYYNTILYYTILYYNILHIYLMVLS